MRSLHSNRYSANILRISFKTYVLLNLKMTLRFAWITQTQLPICNKHSCTCNIYISWLLVLLQVICPIICIIWLHLFTFNSSKSFSAFYVNLNPGLITFLLLSDLLSKRLFAPFSMLCSNWCNSRWEFNRNSQYLLQKLSYH